LMRRIAFIGLGAMGKPMSQNLLRQGFPLTVYDLRPEPVAELVALGATPAGSSREAAAGAEVVITMLPSSPDVERAALGPAGVREGIRPGSIYIDMSTIAPSTTQQVGAALAEQGVRMLDAPVTRQVAAAVAGTLCILVGGDAAVLEEVRDVLSAMGTDIYHCGELGAGEVVKLCNNLLVVTNFWAAAEALVLGVKSGVNADILVEAIGAGSGNSFVLQRHVKEFVLQNKFEEGVFPVDYALKDLGLALQMGREQHVPLLCGAVASQMLEPARAKGDAKRYFPVAIKTLEELAGVVVRSAGYVNEQG